MVSRATCGNNVFKKTYTMLNRQFPNIKLITSSSSSTIFRNFCSDFEMDNVGIFVDTRNAVKVNNVPPFMFLVSTVKVIRNNDGSKLAISEDEILPDLFWYPNIFRTLY